MHFARVLRGFWHNLFVVLRVLKEKCRPFEFLLFSGVCSQWGRRVLEHKRQVVRVTDPEIEPLIVVAGVGQTFSAAAHYILHCRLWCRCSARRDEPARWGARACLCSPCLSACHFVCLC